MMNLILSLLLTITIPLSIDPMIDDDSEGLIESGLGSNCGGKRPCVIYVIQLLYFVSSINGLILIYCVTIAVDGLNIDSPALSDMVHWWNNGIVNDALYLMNLSFLPVMVAVVLTFVCMVATTFSIPAAVVATCLFAGLVSRVWKVRSSQSRRFEARYGKDAEIAESYSPRRAFLAAWTTSKQWNQI